jgi:hypothetical protein
MPGFPGKDDVTDYHALSFSDDLKRPQKRPHVAWALAWSAEPIMLLMGGSIRRMYPISTGMLLASVRYATFLRTCRARTSLISVW